MNLSNCGQSVFQFDKFEPEIIETLSACRYINLPFDISGVGPEINHLLTECGKTFFQTDINEDSLRNTLKNAKIILDFSWEKINTGHWKEVDKIWRDVYTLASIFKVLCLLAMKNTDKLDIIKECDKGLLLGAPIMGNTLSKIAFKLSSILLMEKKQSFHDYETKPKRRKTDASEDIVLSYKIHEKQNITNEEFNIHMEKAEPIILIKAIADWPAMSSKPWSVEYILEKTCFRTVPIELGSKYTDENWTQKLMTVENFVEKYIWNKSKQKEIGYLAQHNLFIQIPELKNDIIIPNYINDTNFVDISIWFGPSGTISPLHYDPKHNLLAQVVGTKYVRLYSKEQTPNLYAKKDPLFYNTSQVDVENADFNNFPLFKEAIYSESILKPGNLLYIPPGCWHYIRSLSTSISISFWW